MPEDTTKTATKRLPLHHRIGLSVLSVIVAFMFALNLMFGVHLPDNYAMFALFTTAAIGIGLAQLLYKSSPRTVLVSMLLSLTAWIALLNTVMPPLAKDMRLRIAHEEILVYPHAELLRISYSAGGGDNESTVNFVYRSEKPDEEFPKIKEHFKNNLDESKWKYFDKASVLGLDHPEKTLDPISFSKRQRRLPSISINFYEKRPDPIIVHASF